MVALATILLKVVMATIPSMAGMEMIIYLGAVVMMPCMAVLAMILLTQVFGTH